jgi:hypothetical protein
VASQYHLERCNQEVEPSVSTEQTDTTQTDTTQTDTTHEAVVQEIAATLNEPNIDLLRTVVSVIGAERAQEFLQRTLAIEAEGGLMLTSEARRRTPGGVFFYTVRKNIPTAERKQIWPKPYRGGTSQPAAPPAPPLTWDQARKVAIKMLSATKGKAIVKVTLIGRPKQVGKAQSCVVCVMEDRGAPASMPKGLPTPPTNAKQTVTVFIGEKQWRKVEASLKENKEDELIIDGWPYFDPNKQMTIVLAQGVTSKLIQRGRREDA